ncbi:hypothetical protein L195_g014973 [Trifolium pratense]|uniref:Uncharacterized protein n=1 Tax=Trifolium pratense TaxID=57577 RepID=A0A2K3MM37_TRIPR|nr:hypothetical protein L195_g014973 [Trifolium pratense]
MDGKMRMVDEESWMEKDRRRKMERGQMERYGERRQMERYGESWMERDR